jgi:flagellin-like hook-associated protein FlgL
METANLAIDMNVETGAIPTNEAGIIGNYKGGTATNAFVIGFWQGQTFLYSKSNKPDTNVLNTNVAPDTKLHIQANYDSSNNTKSIEINGIKKENNAYTVDDFSDEPITIFKGNATLGKASMKLYDCKIYDDGVLVKDYIPVVDHNGKVALYDKVNEELVYDENGGDFIAGPPVITPPPTISTTTLQVGGDAGIDNTIKLSLNVEFGILTGSVMNEADSKTLLNSAQSYMDKVLISRSQIGSALNRLETARNLQNNDIVNLNSSKSIITDTDIASESTNLAHSQILQQISTSLFSQANGINRNLALRLLGV